MGDIKPQREAEGRGAFKLDLEGGQGILEAKQGGKDISSKGIALAKA